MNPRDVELDVFSGVEAAESFHLFLDGGGKLLDRVLVVGEDERTVEAVRLAAGEGLYGFLGP